MTLSVGLVALLAGPLAPRAQQAAPFDDFDHLQTGFPLTGSHERVRCERCHVGGTFQGTPRECGTCHSGGGFWQATRKPANHVPSSEHCADCHLTTSWAAARFDHSQVTGGCFRCHNGSTATAKHSNHVQSSNDCELCHGTLAWVPARFDHGMVTGSCYSCHNGTFARGTPGDHPPSSNNCEECHRTTAWLPAQFTHTSPDYPDHGGRLDCNDCHSGGSETVTYSSPGYRPDCAGCHANDFEPDEHKKVDSPRILYTVSELRDCSGTCHQYTDATFSTIEKTRNGEHRANGGGW